MFALCTRDSILRLFTYNPCISDSLLAVQMTEDDEIKYWSAAGITMTILNKGGEKGLDRGELENFYWAA